MQRSSCPPGAIVRRNPDALGHRNHAAPRGVGIALVPMPSPALADTSGNISWQPLPMSARKTCKPSPIANEPEAMAGHCLAKRHGLLTSILAKRAAI